MKNRGKTGGGAQASWSQIILQTQVKRFLSHEDVHITPLKTQPMNTVKKHAYQTNDKSRTNHTDSPPAASERLRGLLKTDFHLHGRSISARAILVGT